MLAWSKLAWFREESPAVYGRIAHVTSLADWLAHELTGELHLERGLGVEAGLVDVASGEPAHQIAAKLGFEGVAFPTLIDPWDVVGHTSNARTDFLGFLGRVPVVVAGPDTQAGLAGMGIASPGEVGILAGWSGVVQRVTDRTVFDPERGLWAGRHVLQGCHVLEGNTGVMGGAFEWLVRLVSGGQARIEDYAALDRAAGKKGRGAGSVSAHLGPDSLNLSKSSLRAGGFIFPVPLALEPPDAGALGRAAIENFAFAIRANLERLDQVARSAASAVSVGGGLTRSATFRRVVADVTGRPVCFGSPDASLLGAVTLAAAAIGVGPSLESALRLRSRTCRTVAPDPVAVEEYEGLYGQWRHRGDILAQIGL
jgi:sugar (pentulose or hexulose) kinase